MIRSDTIGYKCERANKSKKFLFMWVVGTEWLCFDDYFLNIGKDFESGRFLPNDKREIPKGAYNASVHSLK
jgi:hypothetical protein